MRPVQLLQWIMLLFVRLIRCKFPFRLHAKSLFADHMVSNGEQLVDCYSFRLVIGSSNSNRENFICICIFVLFTRFARDALIVAGEQRLCWWLCAANEMEENLLTFNRKSVDFLFILSINWNLLSVVFVFVRRDCRSAVHNSQGNSICGSIYFVSIFSSAIRFFVRDML